MTVRWTVRAAEPTEQGYARGETGEPYALPRQPPRFNLPFIAPCNSEFK